MNENLERMKEFRMNFGIYERRECKKNERKKWRGEVRRVFRKGGRNRKKKELRNKSRK